MMMDELEKVLNPFFKAAQAEALKVLAMCIGFGMLVATAESLYCWHPNVFGFAWHSRSQAGTRDGA